MKRLQAFYWIMIVGFVVLMIFMATLNERVGEAYPYIWLTLDGIFLLGGVGVMVVTAKEKVTGWLKTCLMTDGIVSLIFLITIVLQNWLWIVGIKGLSIALYYVAMFACPVVFAIAAITAGILLYRKRQS